MMIRTLIVDDEPLARRGIALLLASQADFFVVDECRNGEEAVKRIAELKPDLLFLDIQMPGMSGFDVLASLSPDTLPATIFLTAFDEYAVAAFDIQALDYLLKPIDEDRFLVTLNRAREMLTIKRLAAQRHNISGLLELQAERQQSGPSTRFVVRERGRSFFVVPDEIEWIEAVGDYVGLHVGSRTHLLRESMSIFEAKLDRTRFVRIHRSAIVRLDCVMATHARTNRDCLVQLKSGIQLKVSRTYSSGFFESLNRFASLNASGLALPHSS